MLSRLDTDAHPGSLVKMLNANFEPGDETYLWKALNSVQEPAEIHYRNKDIRAVIEKHWPPTSNELLVDMFDSEYCSFCRHSIYALLRDHAAMPDWMRREGQFDADSQLREMAIADCASALSQDSPTP